jgi:hypothetical protein
MRQLVVKSTLPTLTLDVSDSDVPGAADRIADWLAATGGAAGEIGAARGGRSVDQNCLSCFTLAPM